MKIVVLDGFTLNPGDNPWDAVAPLGEFVCHDRTSADQTIERAKDAEIVLTNKTVLNRETLELLPRLKFISVLATGYNVVDTAYARERDVIVSNVPAYSTDSVAQLVFALLLELCHNVRHHSDAVKAGRWTHCEDFCFWDSPLIELAGKTMGIVGFGRIGRRAGEVARAFGMNVIAASCSRNNPPDYPFEWREIDEVFAEADVVSLHCPQTAENTGMVNAMLLSRMKRSAFFINTARGGLVNEADLAQALMDGALAGAALDVTSTEPIAADNPLLKAPNVIFTPHIAWATLEARQRLMRITAENVQAFIAGDPINVVN
ncbi:D-2-hydroxyacid dehydrogenase [Candidatus Sumerlaeota bacterium]|nr:D-2-hydroxyacid dehydrogenase [Candidatus Sumerlaeota bacterium]